MIGAVSDKLAVVNVLDAVVVGDCAGVVICIVDTFAAWLVVTGRIVKLTPANYINRKV